MKIFLIRHGETTGDIEDRYGGDYEDHLTQKGVEQTERLTINLANKGIELIISSPRDRARETVAVLNRKIAVPVEFVDNLRERNHYGSLTGMVKSEAREKFPKDCEKVKSHLTNATGGETYDDFMARINRALQEIYQSDKQVIAVVTHGQFIKAIFRDILMFGEVVVEDCGFAELDFDGKELTVVSLSGIEKKP